MATRQILDDVANYHRPSRFGEDNQKSLPATSDPSDRYDVERFEILGRSVAAALATGNFDLARQALERKIGELEAENDLPPCLSVPLTELGLSVKLTNALEGVGVCTVQDVLSTQLETMAAIPNFGIKSMVVVLMALLRHMVKYVPLD